MNNIDGVIIIILILLMLVSISLISYSLNRNNRSTVRTIRFPDDTYMKYHIIGDVYFIIEVSGNRYTILNYLDKIVEDGKTFEFHPFIKDRFIKK